MNYKESDIDRFDLYLRQEMGAEDLLVFEDQLIKDQSFKAAFEMHRLLAQGIKDHAREDLKSYLKEHGKVETFGRQYGLKSMVFAAAATFIIFIGLYAVIQFYVQPEENKLIALQTEETENRDANDSVRSLESDQPAEIAANSEAESTYPSKDVLVKEAAKGMYSPSLETLDAAPPTIAELDDNLEAYSRESTEYKSIATERKIMDTVMNAPLLVMGAMDQDYMIKTAPTYSNRLDVSTSKTLKKSGLKTKDNIANKSKQEPASEKTLIDTVSLAEDSQKKAENTGAVAWTSKTYVLEFWTSPVNFQGYELKNGVVKLYGMDTLSSRLFLYNNQLYLRSSGKVYILAPCPNACPYQQETDMTIVNLILKQN